MKPYHKMARHVPAATKSFQIVVNVTAGLTRASHEKDTID
jgi:hypothetical protein